MSETHELPAGPSDQKKKSWGKENLGKWQTHRLRKEMIRCFAARITRPVSAHENRFFSFSFFSFFFSNVIQHPGNGTLPIPSHSSQFSVERQ